MAQSNQFTELNQRVAEEIPGLLRFAVKLTGDIHSAEDVVQEALLRAARSISTFRREASFRTWLMQIVLNVFRTHAGRRRPLEQPLEAAAHASSQATVQQDLEAAETRDHVAIAGWTVTSPAAGGVGADDVGKLLCGRGRHDAGYQRSERLFQPECSSQQPETEPDSGRTMSQNDFDNDNDEVTDEGLDQILNAAFWPEADDAAVGRLQRVWADAVREQQPVERPRLIRSEVATVHPRRFASRVVAALGIVAGIVIAFFAGRWTQSVPQPAMNVVESAGRPEAEATTEPGNVERPSMDLPTRAMPESPSIVVQDSVHGIVGEPSTVLSPVPESQLGGRRGRTRTASLKQQLETVLTCIEQTANPQSSCVEPLLKWRRESEYVLWQVVQNATGQRRLAAITAIGFVGSDESVPSLLPGLADAELRETAKQAIMRCADVSTLAIFVRQTQEPELAAEFAQTLIGRPAMNSQPVFLQLVVHPDSRATCLAVGG
jgi:RNA polymerase sigma factor (sigma-70 family)